MRKWVLAGVVVLLVGGGLLGWAFANLGRYLQQNREWVAAQASRVLGRTVTFDEIGVTFAGGVAARLGNLRVADDPAYGGGDFLRARDVRVSVRLLPALFGRYEVRRVVIVEPELRIIRDRRGLNVASLGSGAEQKRDGGGAAAPRPATSGGGPELGAAAALLVSALEIEDGRLRWLDRTTTPPTELAIGQLDVEASGVGFETPVRFRVEAAVNDAKKQNVEIEGVAGPLGPAAGGGELPVDVTIALDEVAPFAVSGRIAAKMRVQQRPEGAPSATGTATLEKVSAAPPGVPWSVRDLSSTVELRGTSAVVRPSRFSVAGVPLEAEATVERFAPPAATFAVRAAELPLRPFGFGAEGVEKAEVVRDLSVTGRAELGEGGPAVTAAIRSPRGSARDVDYEGLETDVTLRGPVATLERLRVGAYGGTCEGSGRYDMRDAARPRFDGRTAVRGMALRELLAAQAPGTAGLLEGRLDATFTLAGAGKERAAIERSLTGQGRVDVRDGVLKDVNLAEGALGGVTGIPGLTMLVPPKVRGKYPELFGTGDTRFEELGADVRVADRRATTDNLRVAARDYAVTGRGWVDFAKQVDFTATLVASPGLTADVVDAAREARYITNEEGRLAMPFRLAGTLPKVRPGPDADFVARAVGKAAVGKGVDKLLDNLGGKKKKGQKERPEQELLRKGLEGLLGR